jgi:replicative DNA helicase
MNRLPPQDLTAEKAVLGSIMLRSGALTEIEDVLTPESFYVEKHRLIFNTMLALFTKNEPIDLLSVSTRLKEKSLLENIGGRSYLASLVEEVPASTNIKHYAGIVAKKAMLRALIESGDYISEIGFNEALDIEDVLDRAEKRIFGVVNQPRQNRVTSIGEKISGAW